MTSNFLSFAEFKLDALNRLLIKMSGEEIALNFKTLSVLQCLLAEQGSVITREFLIKQVWDDNFPVGDKALTTAIWNLRKAFEGSSVQIETIPKKGYKLNLVQKIEIDGAQEDVAPSSMTEQVGDDSQTPPNQKTRFNRKISLVVAVSILLAISVILTSRYFFVEPGLQDSSSQDVQSQQNRAVLLVSLNGESPEIQSFVDALSSALSKSNGLNFVNDEIKHRIIQSNSKEKAASEQGISHLLALKVHQVSESQAMVSIQYKGLSSGSVMSANWSLELDALDALIPQILGQLPNNKWQ